MDQCLKNQAGGTTITKNYYYWQIKYMYVLYIAIGDSCVSLQREIDVKSQRNIGLAC